MARERLFPAVTGALGIDSGSVVDASAGAVSLVVGLVSFSLSARAVTVSSRVANFARRVCKMSDVAADDKAADVILLLLA